MRATYDAQADALYVQLRDEHLAVRTIELDDCHMVDCDEEGGAVGLEVLGVGDGTSARAALHEIGLNSEDRQAAEAAIDQVLNAR